jgi:peptide/nickel transport system ATP-binding protein
MVLATVWSGQDWHNGFGTFDPDQFLVESTIKVREFIGVHTHLVQHGGVQVFHMQPVFQDPYGSLDPLQNIANTIAEPLVTHKVGTRKEREARVRELLDQVSLPWAISTRYPSELSGGQRQRVAIARALALKPQLVVLDEAVSALDVLVQAQVLELLAKLQDELNLTYLFITHDLAVVKVIADEVAVMNQGKIVEFGNTKEIFANPQQQYTKNLLEAIPGAKLI